MMNKNISLKIFAIIALFIVIALSYFTLKDTKSVEIKNENIAPAENVANQNDEVAEVIEVEKNNSTEAPAPIETKVDDSTVKSVEQKISTPNIINKNISWGYQSASGRLIDTIVIHSSYDALGDDPYSVSGLIAEYKQYGVAAHYLIDRQGNIYQLVKDKNIAYHAGVSSVPDGRSNVNNFSIGIELMNTKSDKFTSKQYDSLSRLVDYLKSEYKIKYTLGHNQIAPERKDDPWNFDWSKI